MSAFRHAMYRQDALYAALLALVDDFEREAATATAEPPAAAAADCELGAAALADDLTLLRVTLERCAATASSGALEAARAARDRHTLTKVVCFSPQASTRHYGTLEKSLSLPRGTL